MLQVPCSAPLLQAVSRSDLEKDYLMASLIISLTISWST